MVFHFPLVVYAAGLANDLASGQSYIPVGVTL